jgi:hypothetical protein
MAVDYGQALDTEAGTDRVSEAIVLVGSVPCPMLDKGHEVAD